MRYVLLPISALLLCIGLAFAQPAPTDPSVVTTPALGVTDPVPANAIVVQSGDQTVTEPAVVVPANDNTVVIPTEDGTTVVVPYGNWLDTLLSNVGEVALAAFLALISILGRHLPAGIGHLFKTVVFEQFARNALTYAINATRNAVKGRTLTLEVGSEVLAKALNFIIDKAPSWLLSWMGGKDSILKSLMARLDLDETVSSETILPAATAKAAQGVR